MRIPNVDVRLDDAELAVTQTRIFQRLFYLKQVGLAYLVYPAATHTRGAHSIQTLYEAARILDALKIPIDSEDAQNVRMAALLHDIGHLPFSHSLEDEHAILPKHDRPERLGWALDELSKEVDPQTRRRIEGARPILHAISGGDDVPQDWRSDLVGNTVCADLLAYIRTDAEWTGIEKRPGYYRIYDYFRIEDNRLCIRLTKGGLRNDVVSTITDLLDMRYALTERVIFHHAKCTASAMLARAARLVGLKEGRELLRFGDEAFLDHLEKLATEKKSSGATNLISGIRSRRLYQRVFKLGRKARDGWDDGRMQGAFCEKWRDPAKVEELLTKVEKTHNLPVGTLVLWCPPGKAGMKLARAHVTWESADKVNGPFELRGDEVQQQYSGVGQRVKMIENQYLDLWTFWIAMDRAYISQAATVVKSLEELIGVDCDPVFKETYLHSIPGYEEMDGKVREVSEKLQGLAGEVSERLAGQAARTGDAGLEGHGLDDAIVFAATRDVMKIREGSKDRSRDKRPPPSGPAQSTLQTAAKDPPLKPETGAEDE